MREGVKPSACHFEKHLQNRRARPVRLSELDSFNQLKIGKYHLTIDDSKSSKLVSFCDFVGVTGRALNHHNNS